MVVYVKSGAASMHALMIAGVKELGKYFSRVLMIEYCRNCTLRYLYRIRTAHVREDGDPFYFFRMVELTLTVRLIRNFEFRNYKNLIIKAPAEMTVQDLMARVQAGQ